MHVEVKTCASLGVEPPAAEPFRKKCPSRAQKAFSKTKRDAPHTVGSVSTSPIYLYELTPQRLSKQHNIVLTKLPLQGEGAPTAWAAARDVASPP